MKKINVESNVENVKIYEQVVKHIVNNVWNIEKWQQQQHDVNNLVKNKAKIFY